MTYENTRTNDPDRCPECKGVGMLPGPNGWYNCHCRKRAKRERLFRRSGISADFQRLTFDGFKREGRPEVVKTMYHAAVAYRNDFSEIKESRANSLLFMGQPGSGKTHLMAAAANELINDFVDVVYFPYVEMMEAFKADFDAMEEKISVMKTCGLLFIDDLFKTAGGYPSDWETRQMYGIINARYLEHRPMMITTERTPRDLLEIDEATGSRILEMCKGRSVTATGDRAQLNYRIANLA